MDLQVGDKVIYNFPNPLTEGQKQFIGTIEIIADTCIYLRNEEGVRLKVSFKNFDLMEAAENMELLEPVTENFYG